MGGGASKKSQSKGTGRKSNAAAERKEAAAAASSVKASITGQIQHRNFRDVYRVLQKEALGSGMTGAVHEWVHRQTSQPVAIKTVRKRGMREAAIQDMRREIELLSQLDHPNIVKILEAFEDNVAITLVMEICKGGELFDNLIEQTQYTEQRAAHLFKQMVEAVHYCHKMNVTHRDLKLENFVFETKEKHSVLKLIDFGLSKRYMGGGGISRMKTMVGTSYYMAPEVLDQHVSYNNKCDVWSLGVILYMMLTGSPPFGGRNETEILENVRHNNIRFDSDDWADMREAEDLVRHMIVFDPSHRYSCKDVLDSKWLRKNAYSDVQQMISSDVIKSMTQYANMEKLKKTAVQVVAVTLSPAEINKLRDQFKVFDTDGSGTVSLSEFRAGMEKTAGMDSQSIAELFSKIDSDHTGLISYSEFISASLSTSVHLNEDRLCAAFDKLDPDSSGFIDAHELSTLLKDTVKQEDIEKMIASADAVTGDTDGKISKKEFLSVVSDHA